ncbi:YbjQ family protein [Amylibacter sp.]|nr:YbjQ family protein [Amylibacter sp.]
MAKCTVCEKEMGFADKVNAKSFDGLCRSCTDHNRKIAAGLEDKTIEEAAFDTRELDAIIDAIMLTTSHTLQSIEVTKYLGVVSAECAYGMNMFKDMFANVRNLVGGRSTAVQDTMRDSRETVMQELKREAHAKGANAVIAVDIDYTQLGAGGNMMVLVSASGTAVVIEE